MAALTNLSDVVNLATGGNSGTPQAPWCWKDSRVGAAAAAATVAGQWSSLWQYNGTVPGGAAPGAVSAPSNATQGALGQASPGGGRQQYMLGASVAGDQQGTLILYDRLLHISGLSGTVTTAQAVGGALTRNTGGLGNQIWVEIYTQIGASSTTISASYTNQAGTSGQTTPATAIGNTGLREAQRMIPLTLASGDSGVQAVASVTLAATTGTAGDFGIVVLQPILTLSVPVVGLGSIRNLLTEIPGPAPINSGACLTLAWLPQGTSAPRILFNTLFIEK